MVGFDVFIEWALPRIFAPAVLVFVIGLAIHIRRTRLKVSEREENDAEKFS